MRQRLAFHPEAWPTSRVWRGAVSWVVPSGALSEHNDGERISPAQTYVTGLISSLIHCREWKSTAIFLTWDD